MLKEEVVVDCVVTNVGAAGKGTGVGTGVGAGMLLTLHVGPVPLHLSGKKKTHVVGECLQELLRIDRVSLHCWMRVVTVVLLAMKPLRFHSARSMIPHFIIARLPHVGHSGLQTIDYVL